MIDLVNARYVSHGSVLPPSRLLAAGTLLEVDIMTEKINIDTRNSGNRGLLRHLIPTAANTGRTCTFLEKSADLAVNLKRNLPTGAGTESLDKALHRFTPFLDLSEAEIMERLISAGSSNPKGKYGEVKSITLNNKPLQTFLSDSQTSKLAMRSGLSLPLTDMVVAAWTGQTTVPAAFLHSSPSHIKQLLHKDDSSKAEHIIPVPIVMAMGTCACCLSNDFTVAVDNHLLLSDLPASSIVKVLKDSAAVSAHDTSYAELVSGFLPQDEGDSSLLMTYLFSTERRMNNMSLFIPVMRLIIPKANKKAKGKTAPRWAIGWHCVECVRALFDDDDRKFLVARLASIERREDVINMLVKNHRTANLKKLWNEESISRRGSRIAGQTRQDNERKSKGRTPGNVPQLRKDELKELIDSFVEHFGPKSSEVKTHLFYHKSSKEHRIDQKSSLTAIRKIMNSQVSSRKENEDLISDIISLANLGSKPTTAAPVEDDGGEEE